MLDLKFIRENPDVVRQAMANRQEKSSPLDEILQIDTEKRRKMTELEDLRRNRKQASKERQADAAEAGRALRTKIHDLEEEVKTLDAKLYDLLLQMPNIPLPRFRLARTPAKMSWCAVGANRKNYPSPRNRTGN